MCLVAPVMWLALMTSQVGSQIALGRLARDNEGHLARFALEAEATLFMGEILQVILCPTPIVFQEHSVNRAILFLPCYHDTVALQLVWRRLGFFCGIFLQHGLQFRRVLCSRWLHLLSWFLVLWYERRLRSLGKLSSLDHLFQDLCSDRYDGQLPSVFRLVGLRMLSLFQFKTWR